MSTDGTRVTCLGLLLATAALITVLPASAQSLPLRRAIPEPLPGGCPAVADVSAQTTTPPEEAVREAARLATEASNAAILGDLASARNLLERAASLDPQEPSIAFRFGRTLEGLGEAEAA